MKIFILVCLVLAALGFTNILIELSQVMTQLGLKECRFLTVYAHRIDTFFTKIILECFIERLKSFNVNISP